MRFCKTLAIVAVAALAMVGARVAKADSGGAVDPRVKIVVPTDPTIEPCSEVPEGVSCFTSNSFSNPVAVTGPTLEQLDSAGGFDLVTNFIYEPTDCVNSVCPSSDTLLDLWIAITPTLQNAIYTCALGAVPGGETPAFNTCPAAVGINGNGLELLELECDPTPSSPCTGMLPGEEGSAEVTPEPGEFAMLGLGIALVGFCGWKRRQAVELIRSNQENLAAC
jgi:hypothetical protein